MEVWFRWFSFNTWAIFRFHVNFWRCTHWDPQKNPIKKIGFCLLVIEPPFLGSVFRLKKGPAKPGCQCKETLLKDTAMQTDGNWSEMAAEKLRQEKKKKRRAASAKELWFFSTYCWWLKSCTTWDGWNPINHGIIIILGGAGFQPSTVGLVQSGPLPIIWYNCITSRGPLCRLVCLRMFEV